MIEVDPLPDKYPPGTTKYFIKEIVNNPVTIIIPGRDGRKIVAKVPFEDGGDDTGFLAVDDPTKISLIRELIRARRGGIREVGKEEYEAAKKVASVQEQRRASLKPKSLLNQPIRMDVHERSAVDAGKAAPEPQYPSPVDAYSRPPEDPIKAIEPATVSEVNERTPKPAKKTRKTASQIPQIPEVKPPLAFSGATVDP